MGYVERRAACVPKSFIRRMVLSVPLRHDGQEQETGDAMFNKRVVLIILLPTVFIMAGVVLAIAMDKESESEQKTELWTIRSAVIAMMVENGLTSLPNPVSEPTRDMTKFPDATTSPQQKGLSAKDKPGYVLYGHDYLPDEGPVLTVGYISMHRTNWAYTATSDGSVRQR